MTVPVEKGGRLGHGRRVALWRLGVSAIAALFGIIGLGATGFRVNVTPSEPLGLWRIVGVDRVLQNGDLVFVCPPVTDVMREALMRGYLRPGLCTGGFAPLIKTVAANSGQRIEIGGLVRIDGRPLPHSGLMPRDGQGRRMVAFAGGAVPPGEIYLHSDFPGSFDSRYFGPLPVESVLGLAQEVWTYAP
ncbi:conjugative transfer signal peptidase TraF [Rhizobium sp. AC44/96]|uniref:conjugative transfer signal peptidase TraF n=1 Tax=unclassified Rhizobium TaxID=2613769 RepID=UPI0008100BFE|nr:MULTISPECIES: conjugative transfer signal peptidase TraF [unclassified Rhizobium]MDM9621925.1 conjugative transfer signal peptidase TraF [Rhizobium sp. S96]OCJ17201.1 conjugative transfer signal peptidase TraF [Rhizobium sp. AC44/96]